MKACMHLPSIALAALVLTGAAQAQSSIVLRMAGEAFEGAPRFEVTVAGQVVGTGVLDRAIDTTRNGRLFSLQSSEGLVQEFAFEVPDGILSADAAVAVAISNDAFLDKGEGYDRNLFVQSIAVNGAIVAVGDLRSSRPAGYRPAEPVLDMLPVFEIGDLVVADPPSSGWPGAGAGAKQARSAPIPGSRPAGLVPQPVVQR